MSGCGDVGCGGRVCVGWCGWVWLWLGEGVWGCMVAVGGEVVCVHGWGLEVWVCGYGCWCVGVVYRCGLYVCV